MSNGHLDEDQDESHQKEDYESNKSCTRIQSKVNLGLEGKCSQRNTDDCSDSNGQENRIGLDVSSYDSQEKRFKDSEDSQENEVVRELPSKVSATHERDQDNHCSGESKPNDPGVGSGKSFGSITQ